MDLTHWTAAEIAQKVKKKEISALEVTRSFLERIQKINPKVQAFLRMGEESAQDLARAIDEKIRQGQPVGELAGVPVAVKDNICDRNGKTTCSSKILENFIAPYDATVVKKLKSQDAIPVGKTNLDEFAMGSSTENSAFFTTKNPWDLKRVPGGSSGGSAAAVSSRMAPLALGSDTGGSIRQPASFCGVVGIKPTYGRVSRYGLIAFASSLDQIGPFSNTAEDAALFLKVISGHDPLDSTSYDGEVPDYPQEIKHPLKKGLKIGIAKEYFVSGLDSTVRQKVMDAVHIFEKMGAEVVDVSLPHTDHAIAVYYILAP
ncbi:MAG: Asp-tRNA(Asn)/Glu-tRNA(Gln) amidotransferase subunit GatA, partial [Elusimicrobia bacterium]|nr:Asp-tRNA(Asn)/Glu-tRNA(Gln) amidotransferase subunit GatA [Elusimicrobiota bacterium]